ncbi:MAG TPA: hypothetical protein VJ799_00830, partial [Nitrososphaeraceae archaeon]|nr:hypothetical protein [Nitrososphaeraceae archaeon]
AEEKGIEISQQLEVNLVQILIVKYFTHFKNDISNSLLSEGKTIGVLDVLEHFQVTGLLGECIDNMFLPEEVRKVFSKITDFSAKGLFALDLNDEAIKKFSELKLKNQDVFDKLKKI